MKKIAVAVLATALLMMIFALPVMATPKDSSPAWHTYPATDTYEEITYEALTERCLAAGLKKNPYPAPTTPTEKWAGPILTLTGASSYYIFTITIGDNVYLGVACNIYDMTLNIVTGEAHLVEQSTHYFGVLGDMNHGFKGVVTVDVQVGGFTASWVLNNGFGRFTGQSLTLSQDSSKAEVIGTGTCLVLGNKWYK